MAPGAAGGGGPFLLDLRGGVRDQLRALRPGAGPPHHALQGAHEPDHDRRGAGGRGAGAAPARVHGDRHEPGQRERLLAVHVQDPAHGGRGLGLQEAVLLPDGAQRVPVLLPPHRGPVTGQGSLCAVQREGVSGGLPPQLRRQRAARVQRARPLPPYAQLTDVLHPLRRGGPVREWGGRGRPGRAAAAREPGVAAGHVLPGRAADLAVEAAAQRGQAGGRGFRGRPHHSGDQADGEAQRGAHPPAAQGDHAQRAEGGPGGGGRAAAQRAEGGERARRGGPEQPQPLQDGPHMAALVLGGIWGGGASV
mmetsp:Transcript_35301/g.111568  ORF Transcript_35301/g.111568 Transcript_35301/m.111568 type:complete len:307 (+) Transcript_35301:3068-3988(+)